MTKMKYLCNAIRPGTLLVHLSPGRDTKKPLVVYAASQAVSRAYHMDGPEVSPFSVRVTEFGFLDEDGIRQDEAIRSILQVPGAVYVMLDEHWHIVDVDYGSWQCGDTVYSLKLIPGKVGGVKPNDTYIIGKSEPTMDWMDIRDGIHSRIQVLSLPGDWFPSKAFIRLNAGRTANQTRNDMRGPNHTAVVNASVSQLGRDRLGEYLHLRFGQFPESIRKWWKVWIDWDKKTYVAQFKHPKANWVNMKTYTFSRTSIKALMELLAKEHKGPSIQEIVQSVQPTTKESPMTTTNKFPKYLIQAVSPSGHLTGHTNEANSHEEAVNIASSLVEKGITHSALICKVTHTVSPKRNVDVTPIPDDGE